MSLPDLLTVSRSRWLGDGLALGAGALSVLAFAPFGWWPLAVLAAGALFSAIRGTGWRRGLWRGWLFGLGLFGFGISWIVESFQFNQVAFPVAVGATASLVALLSIYPALAGGLVGWQSRGRTSRAAAVVFWSGTWSGIEWLRGWCFTGFSWLELGASQSDGPLAAWYPLIGSAGTGFVVALLGAVLACSLGSRPGQLVALVSVVTFVMGSQWLGQFDRTEVAGEVIEVGLVQGNVPQDQKWRPENRAPTLATYMRHTKALGTADVVLWPETAIPGLLPRMGDFLAEVQREGTKQGTDILAGIPSIERDSGRPLNAVVKLASQADATGSSRWPVYAKRHLVPFGEYVPWPTVVNPVLRTLGLRLSNFAAGETVQPVLEAGGHPVGISICYEVAFSRDVRLDLPQAHWLVNLSNDAWFGDTIGPHQHLELARVRAREVGRYVVRGTNTGISAFIDHRGRVRERAPQFALTTLSGPVVPRGGATTYVQWGDRPLGMVIGLMLVLGLVARRPARAHGQSEQVPP